MSAYFSLVTAPMQFYFAQKVKKLNKKKCRMPLEFDTSSSDKRHTDKKVHMI